MIDIVGVSTYRPLDGEHIVLSYNKWEILGRIPQCYKQITLTYTIENTRADTGERFSGVLEIETTRKPFYEIMVDAARMDARFQ